MKQLTPKQIVKELDRYIVGQMNAKKAVAIALRNRWRRQQVDGKLKDEIMPNNIIMIGSTGVGKTEIARRLASLANAPFVKVEASKFTEVGYVGRDVESMIRDLMDTAISIVEREKEDEVIELAEHLANERIIDILFPDDQKEVLIMRLYRDMSFKEIAENTNVSINTALGRMRYAIINLRKLVAEHKIILEA